MCRGGITVTVLTKFVRHGCLAIVGFTNTRLIFSNFKITFCTSLWVSEFYEEMFPENREENDQT